MNRLSIRPMLLVAAAGTMLLFLRVTQGQSPPSVGFAKVPVGAIASQLTGRLVGDGGIGGEYELIGYLTFLEGLGAAVFAGEPIERNAQFAFRSDPFRFQVLANGPLLNFARLAVPATQPSLIRIYYMDKPNRDFDHPYTFSEGDMVGVLRTRGLQGSLVPSMMFRAEGSATLDSADDFTMNDRKVNLKSLGDSAVISFFGVPPSAMEFATSTGLSVPFSGSIRTADRFPDGAVITPGPGTIGPPK